MTLTIAILTTLLPFVGFLLIMVFTRNRPRLSAGLSIAAITLSLAGAVFLLASRGQLPVQYTGRWLVSGDIVIPYGFLLDPVSLLMLTVVAAIYWRVGSVG